MAQIEQQQQQQPTRIEDDNNYKEIVNYPVTLDHVYETENGLEFIDPTNTQFIYKQIELGRFKFAFHFQTVSTACLFGVFNKNHWTITKEMYDHMKYNRFTMGQLLAYLKAGKLDIGISRIGSYHIITEITDYADPNNDEIKLHYFGEKNNVYRSINWDLFRDLIRR